MRLPDFAMRKPPLQKRQSGFSVRVASSRHRMVGETIGKKYLCGIARLIGMGAHRCCGRPFEVIGKSAVARKRLCKGVFANP